MVGGGAISLKGVLACHTFRCNLNSQYYIDILKNHLLPAAKQQFRKNWRLQQNNDPKHRSNITKQFIFDNVSQLLPWPSNSPDANSIEYIWSIVKQKVEKRKPQNIDEFERFLAEEFENVETNVIKNCVMSMKTRSSSLISSKGERIKY